MKLKTLFLSFFLFFSLFQEKKSIVRKAKSYYKLAAYHRKANRKDSAYYYYKKSKKIFINIKDSIQIGRCLLNLSILESDFGDYNNSDISGIESLKYLNGKREKTMISVYNCLAISSKKQRLYDNALYNYKKALSFNLSEIQKNTIQNNIANVYKEQKKYSKSILILENLLKDSIRNLKTKVRIIDNLAHTKWLQNKNASVLVDFKEVLLIRKKEKYNYDLIASYSHLSDYFKETNKTISLFYAKKMYDVAKKENAANGLLESIEKIVALQTPQKSIKYYKESIRLRDSLQEANTKRQYNFAKIKYNYEEEEKQKLSFKSLAIENKLVAEQENNQKKNIFIIAIILTSGLLFYIYRRKQKHKKQVLEANYNTEIRISKRLHDELGNGIYNVITKVLNPKFKTEEVVNDLDKIYLQTRKISHENDAVETGTNFESYLKDLITSYNSDTCTVILNEFSNLELDTLEKETQIVLYRVFNELFVNMKKHSKAFLTVISCKKLKNNYEITYTDNGVGFVDKKVILKNGLLNMETRIKSIGGTLNFENQPKKGCKVTIRFKK